MLSSAPAATSGVWTIDKPAVLIAVEVFGLRCRKFLFLLKRAFQYRFLGADRHDIETIPIHEYMNNGW